MSLDVRILRYFVHVAELGSLTLAARALNIAQPALSQRMASLEDHLGAQLLLRSSRGVELTEEGRRLLDHARYILERFRTIEEEMGRKADVLRGTVTVGMPAPAANVLLVPLVKRIEAAFPELRLRIEEMRTSSLLEGLLASHFDIVVTAQTGESNRVEAELLAQENLHLVAAAPSDLGETVDFHQLFGLPLIISSQINAQRSAMALIARRMEGALDVVLESTSLPTTKKLIAQGGRYAIMTWSAVVDEVARGTLVASRIVEPHLARPLYLCQLRDRRYSTAVQTVAAELRAVAEGLVENDIFR
ncbi:LysR family transcriptional regulator, nitrogen assimilation regulatory protein [Sphingobium faniae]|nr:LysR family transcriptional regulator, nitrogen assimilation regulatory protein [Sphingobium faniae]